MTFFSAFSPSSRSAPWGNGRVLRVSRFRTEDRCAGGGFDSLTVQKGGDPIIDGNKILFRADQEMILTQMDVDFVNRVSGNGTTQFETGSTADGFHHGDLVRINGSLGSIQPQAGADPASILIEFGIVSFASRPGSSSAHQCVEDNLTSRDDTEVVGTGSRRRNSNDGTVRVRDDQSRNGSNSSSDCRRRWHPPFWVCS